MFSFINKISISNFLYLDYLLTKDLIFSFINKISNKKSSFIIKKIIKLSINFTFEVNVKKTFRNYYYIIIIINI